MDYTVIVLIKCREGLNVCLCITNTIITLVVWYPMNTGTYMGI